MREASPSSGGPLVTWPEWKSGRIWGCWRLAVVRNLVEEPPGANHRGEFRAQHLQGDFPVVADVVCEKDRRHPPRS